MSKRQTAKILVTLEVRLYVPQDKTPAQLVNWLAQLINTDMTGPEHEPIPDKQQFVKLVKKETYYA